MKISENGLSFLKREESCRLTAYQDSSKIWTIGYGNTFFFDNTPVKKGDKISQEEADKLLTKLVPDYEQGVQKLLNEGAKLSQNQYDSLVSLSWNIGEDSFVSSTLYQKILKNSNDVRLVDVSQIKEEWLKDRILNKESRKFANTIEYSFLVWNKSGGKNNESLYERRKREYKLYKTK